MKRWIIKKLEALMDRMAKSSMERIARYCITKNRNCDICAIGESCRCMREGLAPGVWQPKAEDYRF